LSNKKKIFFNIITAILTLLATAAINFFLTPYIVRTLGVGAQGFLQLSTNFASYVAVVTIALNAMSGRFISIAVQKGETENACRYYTSVLFGNIFLCAVMTLPLWLFILFIDKIISVHPVLVADVRILFGLSLISLFAGNIILQWNNVFYITDKIYLQSIGNCIGAVLKALLVLVLFVFFAPKMWYMGLAAIVAMCFSAAWGLWFKAKLLPDLRVRLKLFSLAHLKELVLSGIWRSIQGAGEMLLSGLDLLICNLMIGEMAMGVLALSKMLPLFIGQLIWTITSTFAPDLTIKYANGDLEGIKREIKKASKIISVICTIPLAGLMVFGREFFTLWVPTEDSVQLHLLSILICANLAIATGVQPCGNIFVTVNRIKPQAISVILSGLINILFVFLMLRYTNLGIYALAGASMINGTIRNFIYTVPAAASYLGLKWNTFFYGFGYSLIGVAVTVVVGFTVKEVLPVTNWGFLVIAGSVTGGIALVINGLLIFNKGERSSLQTSIMTKFIQQ
jgi:O-antigen/teichoic acid export membrane protein